jgi:site-specific DNA-methyltransferase (adenine-specific)
MRPYYESGGISIYHGDARDVLPSLDIRADIVLTDPPYSSGGMYRSDRSKSTDQKYQHTAETTRSYAAFSGDNRDQRAFEKWCADWSALCLRACREGAAIGCFIDWRNIACVIDAVQMGGWVYRGITPWHKGGDQRPRKAWFRANVEYIVWGSAGPLKAGPGVDGECRDGVLFYRVNGAEKLHQTGKPVDLFAEIISTRPDWQTALDPFMGSGTTLAAAKELGRCAVGVEIDERNCEIAANRLMRAQSLPLEAAS